MLMRLKFAGKKVLLTRCATRSQGINMVQDKVDTAKKMYDSASAVALRASQAAGRASAAAGRASGRLSARTSAAAGRLSRTASGRARALSVRVSGAIRRSSVRVVDESGTLPTHSVLVMPSADDAPEQPRNDGGGDGGNDSSDIFTARLNVRPAQRPRPFKQISRQL